MRKNLAVAAFTGALALMPCMGHAQSEKTEATYVVLGAQGAVARAIVANATACPMITIDGAARAMQVRAAPDAAFPVLVCELLVPQGARSASIADTPLPLPKARLQAIAAFGDTGCRLKSKRAADDSDDDDNGRSKYQACNDPVAWPFAQVAASVAAARPDLIIHVGDYLYRESACPAGDSGCARSPYGDDWPTWNADFFAPAAPALRAAPWIVVRGNHEICKRAGLGYFRLLDPTPAQRDATQEDSAQAAPPCIDLIPQFTVTLAGQSFIVLDSSDAADACPCDAGRYAAQFASMRPQPGSWLLTHRPIWGFRSHHRTINDSLQQALAAWNGKLPDGLALALAGHIHVAEVLGFRDRRSPQFVLGTGGTLLTGKIKEDLSGKKIGGTRVSYGRSDHRFGFAMIAPGPQGLRAAFHDSNSATLFECEISGGSVECNR